MLGRVNKFPASRWCACELRDAGPQNIFGPVLSTWTHGFEEARTDQTILAREVARLLSVFPMAMRQQPRPSTHATLIYCAILEGDPDTHGTTNEVLP
jgi:hypothetical protein